jgi:hypothetical protein
MDFESLKAWLVSEFCDSEDEWSGGLIETSDSRLPCHCCLWNFCLRLSSAASTWDIEVFCGITLRSGITTYIGFEKSVQGFLKWLKINP